MLQVAPPPEIFSNWPAVVRSELQRRHAVMRKRAAGDVVADLGDPSVRGEVAACVAGETLQPPSAESIVSIAGLVCFADLPATLEVLAGMLVAEGELLAVEPVGRASTSGLVASSLGAQLGAVRGLHVARDLPAALRSGGWTVTDLERFVMPTPIWPLRPFVALRAVRFDRPSS